MICSLRAPVEPAPSSVPRPTLGSGPVPDPGLVGTSCRKLPVGDSCRKLPVGRPCACGPVWRLESGSGPVGARTGPVVLRLEPVPFGVRAGGTGAGAGPTWVTPVRARTAGSSGDSARAARSDEALSSCVASRARLRRRGTAIADCTSSASNARSA